MSKEINVGLQSLVLNQPENSNGLVGITLSQQTSSAKTESANKLSELSNEI